MPNTKTALITGAARRIGATTTKRLHQAGCNVIIHYAQSEEDAKQLASSLNDIRANSAHTFRADLLDSSQVAQLADYCNQLFPELDLLVNNASSFYPTPIGKINEKAWNDLMGSNLKAPLFLSQALLNSLSAADGAIINMIDIHGSQPLRHHSVYCAAKAGLKMLTRSLAKDLGPSVRVNGIAPGAILWPEDAAALSIEKQQAIVEQTALKKSGTPDDIADAILYLAQAKYVTGQILAVDGGRSL